MIRLLLGVFLTPSIVVSTKRLVLWRSEIFGGISNEINVILDQSTLLKDLEGILFRSPNMFVFSQNPDLQQRAISRN